MIVSTREMLLKAQKEKFAVPAFNFHNLETIQTIVEGAAEMRSPVILAGTPGTFEYGGRDYLQAIVEVASKKYDEGLLEEMYEDKTADKLIAYCIETSEKIEKNTNESVAPEIEEKINNNELYSLFIYLIYGQMYAFFKSQYLGNTTDNPFPTGEVNRVVKKFKIHEFN